MDRKLKKLIVVILLLLPLRAYPQGMIIANAVPTVTFNGFTHYYPITIDHTKVGTADTTGVPMYFSITNANLKTIGNGGSVTSSSGFDIWWTSDVCVTQVPYYYKATYDAANGIIKGRVLVNTNHTTDAIYNLCFGKSSITTDQSNKAGVFDANVKGTWGLDDNTGTTATADVGPNGTLTNGPTWGTTNAIGTSFVTCDGSNDYIDFTNNSALNITGTTLHISFWIKGNTPGTITYLLSRTNATNNGYAIGNFGTGGTSSMDFRFFGGGSHTTGPSSSAIPWDNTWHKMDFTYDGATMKGYMDAVNDSGFNTSATNAIGTSTSVFTACAFSDGSLNTAASIDEIFIHNTNRSTSYITTQYNAEKTGIITLGTLH